MSCVLLWLCHTSVIRLLTTLLCLLPQEAELKAIAEEAEARQSALKVVAHVYQEKLAAARAACVVPRDHIIREVRLN